MKRAVTTGVGDVEKCSRGQALKHSVVQNKVANSTPSILTEWSTVFRSLVRPSLDTAPPVPMDEFLSSPVIALLFLPTRSPHPATTITAEHTPYQYI
jgi:hypothetical protein